jgi:hypothetical protein
MIYKIYFNLPNLKYPILIHKIVNRTYLIFFKRFFSKNIENEINRLKEFEIHGVNTEKRDFVIDVSLTSFPARIEEVSYTIETIFAQSMKADNITLWLSLNQFPVQKIPHLLELQKKRGLKIEFVEDDLRSHKKYYYAFRNQKNNLVITFDDDVFYPKNTIESLIIAHKKFPNAVICNRGHKIKFNEGVVLKYKKWSHNYFSKKPSSLAVPTGVGGVLYPPNSYHQDIFDVSTFKKISFYADDLWLKIHTFRNNTKVLSLRTYSRDFINVGQSQNFKLVQHNSLEGGNDTQFNNLLDHYQLSAKDFQDEI